MIPWWLYVFGAIGIALPFIQILVKQWMDEQRFSRAGLGDVRKMSWYDFEKYLVHLFRGLGYRVEHTPAQGDYGVDLVLTQPDGQRIAVQAKQWKSRKVGVKALQQVIGGAAYYKCQATWVITTSTYTEQAKQMAAQTGTKLLGLPELTTAMDEFRRRSAAVPKRA